MERTLVIADASPLIGLASAGTFDLLRRLFGQITVTTVVRDEIRAGGSRWGAAEVRAAIDAGWILVEEVDVEDAPTGKLGRGEASVLALARDRRDWCLLLMDDSTGRVRARNAGVAVMGVVGILMAAKREGLVSEVAPFLKRLADTGFRLSDQVLHDALAEAGESPSVVES